MKTIKDAFGRAVRLTDERIAHVLEHPEMAETRDVIAQTLQRPQEVRASRADAAVEPFYVYQESTLVGPKWLCVVVKKI